YARAITVDTGAFVAITDPTDGQHQAAVDCLAQIVARRLPLLTTLPTIYESHRYLLYTRGYDAAIRFLDAVFDGSISIVRTLPEDEARAMVLLRRYAALNLSFVDAVTMAVMERVGVAYIFTFDSDFFVAGFLRVPPL